MTLDELLDDGEARARAAPELASPVEAPEQLEDLLEVLSRDEWKRPKTANIIQIRGLSAGAGVAFARST